MSQISEPSLADQPNRFQPLNIKQWQSQSRAELLTYSALTLLLGVVLYAYWNTLFGHRGIIVAWGNPQYSHGWLIPIFTIGLLFFRWQPFGTVSTSERWIGVAIIGASSLMRVTAAYFRINTIDLYSLVPMLLGVFMLVGGWRTLRWAGPAIAFLIFMFPLNQYTESRVLLPLKSAATVASNFLLQTVGIEAYADGNVIHLPNPQLGQEEQKLGVADACSGLRMLTIFLALSVAITLVNKRPLWEQCVIIASAVPIALLVNIIRIFVTGILYVTVNPELANKVFHDLAGWFMVPLSLAFLYAETQLLSHLWIDEDTELVEIGRTSSGRGLPI